MAVTAPFQFARIPRAVWFPEWGHLVSHDVPFADGYSGTIDIEIEAMTPLLIGGERRGATDAQPGEVWPVQLPDGTYAIPGSSLQGMIRNILEIACFGKLGPWVDKRRFGVRELSGDTARAIYGDRMMVPGRAGTKANPYEPLTLAGWLIKKDGHKLLIPCEMSRIQHSEIAKLKPAISHTEIEKILARSKPYHDKSHEAKCKDAPARYAAFLDKSATDRGELKVNVTLDAKDCHGEKLDHKHSCGYIHYKLCVAGGTEVGTLVLTGKPQGANKWDDKSNELVPAKHTKHMEFVFHGPDRASVDLDCSNAIAIGDDVWRDFDLIHSPPKGSGQKPNPNWEYWKTDFEAEEPVPIFYIAKVNDTGESITRSFTDADGNLINVEIAPGKPIPNTIAAMGTAFMFKLAHKNDTHVMLKNSSKDHLDKECYDLASLIFGGIGDVSNDTWFPHSLKRRASFDWASTLPESNPIPLESSETVLLSPKPSYYPIYVRQPTTRPGNYYATYTSITPSGATGQNILRGYQKPELSGAKIWPVRKDSNEGELPAPPADLTNNGVKNVLHPLPKGTKFSTKLHFHNLRAVELGALLWALTLGDPEALKGNSSKLRHRVGMGKPGNLGSMEIRITRDGTLKIIPNGDGAQPELEHFLAIFEQEMDRVCASLSGNTGSKWDETTQYKALIQSADPLGAIPGLSRPGQSDYMPLKTLDARIGYIENRTAAKAIEPWVSDGTEFKLSE